MHFFTAKIKRAVPYIIGPRAKIKECRTQNEWRVNAPYVKPIGESPTTEDTNFHRHYRSFHSKLESNGLECWPQSQVFRIFQLLPYSRQTSKLFGWQGYSDGKNWVNFKRFLSLILLLLSVFIPPEVTLDSSLTVVWFFWTNHDSFATHSNQWDCLLL